MSLVSAASTFLKPQTPLQQLLEDINFQRTKEMRQLLKDDGGFVVLQGTTYWTDLFVRHFLFQTEPIHSIDSDDLLFFIRKKHIKSSSRYMPKYETEVEVFRKDSRKLPIGDPDVDWEETVYLNMVIHQFDYTLTLAICTRTSPKELQVLRRHSQRVYASPSRRKMDTKGDGEEITYPHICFMVDNFDEVFSDILVRDGEMVCVELVANDKDGAVQGVIFLGSIRYDALKKVYDARQSSLSSKVAQHMSFGLFSSGAGVQTRCEFVRMKGPQGKGHAEMAVTKPKGSGIETPTSEPGFCATDMWDEWDEENDDYCTYRHQRRLSDPSANLNNFTRYSWRKKETKDITGNSASAKALSENEGLDNLASEVSEIEAGDLRDDLHLAFSAFTTRLPQSQSCETLQHESLKSDNVELTNDCGKVKRCTTANALVPVEEVTAGEYILNANKKSSRKDNSSSTGCVNCFCGKKCKHWVSSDNAETPEMSEVYCPTCEDTANETPACLNKMPDKQKKTKLKTSILSVKSEFIVSKRSSLRLTEKKAHNITRSSSLSAVDKKTLKKPERQIQKEDKAKQKICEKIREESNNKSKDHDKKISKSGTNNLLSKVSPKRLRSNKLCEAKQQRWNSPYTLTKNANDVDNTSRNEESKTQEYEIADDATSLNGRELSSNKDCNAKIVSFTNEGDSQLMISVRGKEELPVIQKHTPPSSTEVQENSSETNAYFFEKCLHVPAKSENHLLQLNGSIKNESVPFSERTDKTMKVKHTSAKCNQESLLTFIATSLTINDYNFNHNATPPPQPSTQILSNREEVNCLTDEHKSVYVKTLFRLSKRNSAQQSIYNKALNLVPKRRTPDGTNIYYWCDLPRKALKELDDGAYNPLWASRGFTQSFHFWKENRRQQSAPLNAFLTYVALPWWSIAKDLLDHRETPILTF